MTYSTTYSEMAEAFTIFAKYDTGGDMAAEHDELYAGPDPELVATADKKRLKKLGWSVDTDYTCFHRFV